MDEMREIVTVEQVNRLFLLLAIAGPIVGLLLGAAFGARRRQTRSWAISGFLVGLLCVLNLVVWKVYNLLTDRMGLDTVKNLFVNLALFVGLGAIAGLVYGYYARRRGGPLSEGGFHDDGGSAPVGAVPGGPEAGSGSAARRMEESDEPPRDP